jgi:hypothetical protein
MDIKFIKLNLLLHFRGSISFEVQSYEVQSHSKFGPFRGSVQFEFGPFRGSVIRGSVTFELRSLEVSSAQEDITTFVQDTSQQLGGFTITTGISLGGLAMVAIILLSIVTCIFCRCIAARKAATAAANLVPA